MNRTSRSTAIDAWTLPPGQSGVHRVDGALQAKPQNPQPLPGGWTQTAPPPPTLRLLEAASTAQTCQGSRDAQRDGRWHRPPDPKVHWDSSAHAPSSRNKSPKCSRASRHRRAKADVSSAHKGHLRKARFRAWIY